MKQTTLFIAAAGLCGSMIYSCSSTTNSTPQTDTTQTMDFVKHDATKTQNNDTTFATKAAVGGMAEVALGKMAAEKGSDKQVRDFGNMMVADHSKANDELKGIARVKSIVLPAGLDAEHQEKIDSLGKLIGKDFDNAYVDAMIDGHKKTLALMESEANNGKDAELKAFATKIAPVVKMHLDHIQKIHDNLK